MMLSRSNFSIRKLMPQRRQNSDDDLFWDNDDKTASLMVMNGRGSPSPSLKAKSSKRKGSRSWMSKPSTKKIPQPIIILRSSEDLHRITHIPPLPDTPHSSKSSLCSCEYHAAGFISPRQLPRDRSPGVSPSHGSIRSKTHGERRISPPPGSPLENPRPSPQLPTGARNNKSVKSLPSPTKLTFDLLEALKIQPEKEEMTGPVPLSPPTPPRRKSNPALERELEGLSDDAKQLIREADEAFRSVGTGLAKEETFDLDARLTEAACNTLIPTRPAPAPPASARSLHPRETLAKKRLSNPVLSPLKSPTRSASISKAKRQKSQKSRNGRKVRPVSKKPKSKWSVNAKDLLVVRLFNRLEVDEVLSPTRLQEIRRSRVPQLQPKRSTETLRTIQSDGSDTPVDPFSLQDLPARIGAAGVRLSIPSPIVEVPTPRPCDPSPVTERKTSLVKDGEDISKPDPSSPSPQLPAETAPNPTRLEDETMVFTKDVPFPSPPAKNPLRFATATTTTRKADMAHLPSIPEVTVTSPASPTAPTHPFTPPTLRRRPHGAEAEYDNGDDDDAFIHLPSSPYTLTMPTFRHGPIRLAKADLALLARRRDSGSGRGSSDLAAATSAAATVLDDSLDWTAFHMAILGGAGDLYGGEESAGYYSSREDGGGEVDVDDLCEWFAGFGFDGWGTLGSGESPAGRRRRRRGVHGDEMAREEEGEEDRGSATTGSPCSASSSRSGRWLPIPVEKEFPTGFWNPSSGDEVGAGARGRFERARSVGLRRWTVEGHPKRYDGGVSGGESGSRRPSVDSVASLPQSPMLDLVVSKDSDGNEYVVPMGYNLGHDLGDFLRWEAENVYAAAFYGGEGEEADGEDEDKGSSVVNHLAGG